MTVTDEQAALCRKHGVTSLTDAEYLEHRERIRLDERERCARLVEAQRRDWLELALNPDACFARILDAIRSGAGQLGNGAQSPGQDNPGHPESSEPEQR